jgi:hypothetical protein
VGYKGLVFIGKRTMETVTSAQWDDSKPLTQAMLRAFLKRIPDADWPIRVVTYIAAGDETGWPTYWLEAKPAPPPQEPRHLRVIALPWEMERRLRAQTYSRNLPFEDVLTLLVRKGLADGAVAAPAPRRARQGEADLRTLSWFVPQKFDAQFQKEMRRQKASLQALVTACLEKALATPPVAPPSRPKKPAPQKTVAKKAVTKTAGARSPSRTKKTAPPSSPRPARTR